MAINKIPQYNNSKEWQETSDAWVKTMHESNKRKLAKYGQCNHDDFEWCDVCLITVDGEELVAVE
jgi:hypothetical protein